jgi:hypothetical protein
VAVLWNCCEVNAVPRQLRDGTQLRPKHAPQCIIPHTSRRGTTNGRRAASTKRGLTSRTTAAWRRFRSPAAVAVTAEAPPQCFLTIATMPSTAASESLCLSCICVDNKQCTPQPRRTRQDAARATFIDTPLVSRSRTS